LKSGFSNNEIKDEIERYDVNGYLIVHLYSDIIQILMIIKYYTTVLIAEPSIQ
jgi:hypothetical protein